jgi:DNA invertase Pin-like site-specific DNA recombinase
MTLYAYLRVSTDMQDVNSQKLGVLEYCAAQKLGVPEMVPDCEFAALRRHRCSA